MYNTVNCYTREIICRKFQDEDTGLRKTENIMI